MYETTEDQALALGRAQKIAKAALSGQMHMFLACRKIRDELVKVQNVPEEMLNTFVVIDSECDTYPLGVERETWSKEKLAEKDRLIEAYLVEVRPILENAMKDLLNPQLY